MEQKAITTLNIIDKNEKWPPDVCEALKNWLQIYFCLFWLGSLNIDINLEISQSITIAISHK